MRIRIQRHRFLTAVLVTIVGVVALYLASTRGWAALQDSRPTPSSAIGTLPAVVTRVPASVATTAEYGPLGTISMVYAGTDVRLGLFDSLEPVWLVVSSQDGDTRALSAAGLPEPSAGAISVSPAGDRLAWAAESGIHVYDTATDDVEVVPTEAVTAVGDFSPDGSKLLVETSGLAVLDLTAGRTVAEHPADPGTVRRAAWRQDGSAVDFVTDRTLVTASASGPDSRRQPTDIPERSQLTWAPPGDRLVSLQPSGGSWHLFQSAVGSDGLLADAQQVEVPQTSMERLLGFTGRDSVAVVAYALETGSVQRVLDVPLDAGSPTDLTTLPDRGENWVGAGTMDVATSTLPFGSTEFDEPIWPWTHLSRLVACILLGAFLLGLFVTRRRR